MIMLSQLEPNLSAAEFIDVLGGGWAAYHAHLLAAPKARDYYPHLGMQNHDSCWIVPPRVGTRPGG
jgi:hypothetical protein